MDKPQIEKTKEQTNLESLITETRILSEKAHNILPPATSDDEKRKALLMASYEKILIALISADFELRVIQDSLYCHWFFLEAPLHGPNPAWIEDENPWSHMQPLMDLIINTVNKLPDPELPNEILALNNQMEQFKASLPSPLEIDKVPNDKLIEQGTKVDTIIHDLTCRFLKQRFQVDEITNVMFYYLLRYCTFSGFTESEWQKMNYYLNTIIANIRVYFKTVAGAKL